MSTVDDWWDVAWAERDDPSAPTRAVADGWPRPPAVVALRALVAEAAEPDPDMTTVREALAVLRAWWRLDELLTRDRGGAGADPAWPPPDDPVPPPVADVRGWARRAGLRVSDRGRLPDAVRDLYLAECGCADRTDGGRARTSPAVGRRSRIEERSR